MKLNKIGIVGAGVMGSGIAQKVAQEGFEVVLNDREQGFLDAGMTRIRETLEQGVSRKLFTQEQVEATLARIHPEVDQEKLADADLVVEAIFEDLEVKKALFSRLDGICKPECIFATNTSSFLVSDLAKATKRPDRVIGLHYFFHPAKNRLLEVIPGEASSKESVEIAQLFGKLHGKVTILCRDTPGFVVNRFFIPWYLACFHLLEEGVADIYTIDTVVKETLRIGMGPFKLVNVTGPAIAYHASSGLASCLGDFYAPPDNIIKLAEAGEDWPLPEEGEVDEAARKTVVDRVMGSVFFVVLSLVEEGGASMEDVDRGAKIALRWSMGPFEMMNLFGMEESKRMVKEICERYSLAFPRMLEAQTEPFRFRVVDLATDGPIATITLNRPEASNAINPELVAQLTTCFDAAEANPDVRSIVIRGAGKTFVAGADIRFFVKNIKADRIDDIVSFTRAGTELFRRFETSVKRTIVVLDGQSLGGGSEMALSADAIIATGKGGLQFPETGLGIYPGLGGNQRLAKMIGGALARYFLFTGFPIPAHEARELGLVTELVDPQDLEAAIQKLSAADSIADKFEARLLPEKYRVIADRFTEDNVRALLDGSFDAGDDARLAKMAKIISYKGPVALKMVDRLVAAAESKSLDEGLELELSLLTEIFSTEDAFEGLSKVGRARPEFKGR